MGAPGDLLLVAVMVLVFVGFILPLLHGRAGWILALLHLNICQNDWRPWVTSSSILCASSSGWGPLKFPGERVCAKSSLHLPPHSMEDLPGTPFWWVWLLVRCYLKLCSASFGIRTYPSMEIARLSHHALFYMMLGFEPRTSCALSNLSIKWATSSFQPCGSLQAPLLPTA